ncbi:MAG: SNF2 helicase associated domain-containing protein [Verrucomicrobia bacterium]|nr:SNF2 helicase associated domain-containing protein [Verrucomicrobiota bacterium]
MPVWTEATLRAAASWQAFKLARQFVDSGAVVLGKTTENSAIGSVRSGKNLLRASLTASSPTLFEARCPCPENRSTGALCAHAVALGLAALRPETEKPAPRPGQVPENTPPARSWRIALPPNWADSLRRGRLAASLASLPPGTDPPSPADEALERWLVAAGADPAKSPQHLQLADSRLDAFLAALADHPRITCGRSEDPLEIALGSRIPLAACHLGNGQVTLTPAIETAAAVAVGPSRWLLTPAPPASLTRIAVPDSPAIRPALVQLTDGKSASLPIPVFLRELDPLQAVCQFPADSWPDSLHFVPAACTFELRLDGTPDHLKASLSVRYGDSPPIIPGQAGETGLPRLVADHLCETRDLAAETEVLAVLARAGFKASDQPQVPWSMFDESAATRFLSQTLPALENIWSVRLSPNLARVRAELRTIEPKFEILGSGEDWLSFNLSYKASDGEIISRADMLRLLGSSKSSGGHKKIVSSDHFEVIESLLSEVDIRQEDGAFTARSFAIPIIEEICNKIGNNLVSNVLDAFKAAEIPGTVQADLRPYQRLGFGWLNNRLKRFNGALLADDMGLGKTLQAISTIEELCPADTDPALVVMPTSLLGTWAAEFGRFAPGRKVVVLHGPQRDTLRSEIGPDTVVLTTYATLSRDLAWHLRQKYRIVVADEASQIRNPDTDHAKALFKLRAAHRLALTGTPLENSVRDLWSIFRFILPGWLGERGDFRDRYEVPLSAQPPDATTLARLRLRTAPFILRRTKSQVAPELPSKLAIDEYCDLSPQQASAYTQLLREGRQKIETTVGSGNTGAARMQMLTALLRLRQASCDLALLGSGRFQQMSVSQRSNKMERLLELLESALLNGSKVLVFSQFRTQLQEIEKQILAREWGHLRLDGQSRNRQELVDRFQSPDGPPVFLISLKAGGYGLNLTAADVVIHFDPWWNPAAEAQATDRAHRIGQVRPVTVYRLLSRNTVEEKVVRLQARKRDLAAFIDETGEADAGHLSTDDLRALLE